MAAMILVSEKDVSECFKKAMLGWNILAVLMQYECS